ncbi:hypothetical protein SAMN05216338_106023 [Bradyrhizobium sp. Rc2d]|uniref:alpha/beta fold hydrolase n=1 Tax=Bradyrhizobium sp. Rc2d TaxID=1855321 RepID=UPI0008840297|nr:alpha/beta hydrolase [Bradyrhizobium sp. Rc2d]SDJ68726.1 hypothetical protein SAMN05216338_106023 [Bradyrhizobium sp. Rc2d]
MTFSDVTRRNLIGGLAAGLTAVSVSSSSSAAHALNRYKRLLFLLESPSSEHGVGTASLKGSKSRAKVYAFTLTGLAERSHLLSKDINLDTHITDIANLIEWEDLTNVCLVALSYAGCPASGALERIGNRVSSIVWVDAIKPADGQSFRDLVPFQVEEGAISRPAPKALPPNAYSDPKDVAWVLSKVTPQPIGTFLQPVKLSGAREKVAKKTYIRLPKFQLAALDKAAAECKSDNSWTVLENTTSGHTVMIAEPDCLADVLVKAA